MAIEVGGVEVGEKIWHNGEIKAWGDANIHVMSHVVHYGSSLFEGIRCYATERGPAIFRLGDHVRRLMDSCHIYRMPVKYSRDEIVAACRDLVKMNGFQACYIRPIVFRGFGTFGVNPFPAPVETYIATWAWGKYLGDEALEQGVDTCVSSWARLAPNTFPAMAKSGANYMNSQLIKMEAIVNGFVEGIALDVQGYVSEGSGENIFVVRGDRIITPPLSAGALEGITQDTVIAIAKSMGHEIITGELTRSDLYIADEMFVCGTAAEVSTVNSVDDRPIPCPGPISQAIAAEYARVVRGEVAEFSDWVELAK